MNEETSPQPKPRASITGVTLNGKPVPFVVEAVEPGEGKPVASVMVDLGGEKEGQRE